MSGGYRAWPHVGGKRGCGYHTRPGLVAGGDIEGEGVWCYLSRGVGIEGAWGAAVEGVWSLLGAAPRCGTAEWVLEGKKVGREEGEIVR